MGERTCSIDGCPKPARKRGWCFMHYQRWLRWGTTDLVERPRKPGKPRPVCVVDGCERPHQARGWCKLHYTRWCRTGSVDDKPFVNKGLTCSAPDCPDSAFAGGLCPLHYSRWVKHGALGHPHPRYRAPEGQHWCTPCQAYKPVAEFYANRSRKLGLSDACKDCQKAATGDWQSRHPDFRRDQYRARRRGIHSAEGEAFTRAEIAERDGWLCQICLCLGRGRSQARIGKSYRWPHPRSLSLDHLIPVAHGGAHIRQNVQAAHLGCNWSKNAREVGQQRLFA